MIEPESLRSYHNLLKISIIVPAFNEERLLGASLAQVKSASAAFADIGWDTELIVCDNNSNDNTADIACSAGATVVFEPINQIARARNRGASLATGAWLVFVDADSHPSPELFRDVADHIRSGKCIAGGSTVRLDEHHFLAEVFTRLWNLISRSFNYMAGSFIFCETSAFRKIGGFSNELFAGEELDLSQRLKKLARETGKKIVILHRHPIVSSARKMRLYTMGELFRFFAKAAFNKRRALTSREEAYLWYDGRR